MSGTFSKVGFLTPTELEELTGGGETDLHSHAASGGESSNGILDGGGPTTTYTGTIRIDYGGVS